MPKLHLKRTPAEQAEHDARKAAKAARKARKTLRRRRSASHSSHDEGTSRANDGHGSKSSRTHKRPRGEPGDGDAMWGGSDDDESAAASHRYSNGYKPDYDAIRAELEEKRFREKMLGALEDDEGLNLLESRLNDYAHVPDRWRRDGGKGKGKDRGGDFAGDVDPQYMSDEEYAEWIRVGMWRKTHAAEYAEQQRQQALKDTHRAREKARKAETARLEKAAEEVRRVKKLEKECRRWDEARDAYDKRWKDLLLPSGGDGENGNGALTFDDVPWPLLNAQPRADKTRSRTVAVTIDDLTEDAVSAFLLPPRSSLASDEQDEGEKKRERKEKLRETMLRFHPDKFEGRLLGRVREGDRVRVREAVGQVVRVVNSLMAAA